MKNQSLKIILVIISGVIFSIQAMHNEIELDSIDLDKKVSNNVEQEWGNLQWKEIESNEIVLNKKELKEEPFIIAVLDAINSNSLTNIDVDDIKRYNGNILLHWAMDHKTIYLLKSLIEKQSENKLVPYFTTQLNYFFLLDAIKRNNLMDVKKYSSLVSNLNIKDNKGNSLLHQAARIKNNLEIVEFLVEKGVNIQYRNSDDMTAFDVAIHYYNSKIARYLNNKKKNNSYYYIQTQQEIFNNIRLKSFSVFCNDLFYFISINKDNLDKKNKIGDYSLLHWAIYHKNYPVAYYLLDEGANVNTVNWRGRSPLDTATEYKNTKMIQLLINHGAK